MTQLVSKCVAIMGAAILALALVGCDAQSDDAKDSATESSGFVGSYKTQDTQGNPMSITLDEEGSASGERVGEKMTGSWKDEGSSAAITWSEEWMTKITKDGDTYTKTAYKNGTQDGDAVAAEKAN